MTSKPTLDVTLLSRGDRLIVAGLIGYLVGCTALAVYALIILGLNVRELARPPLPTYETCDGVEQ